MTKRGVGKSGGPGIVSKQRPPDVREGSDAPGALTPGKRVFPSLVTLPGGDGGPQNNSSEASGSASGSRVKKLAVEAKRRGRANAVSKKVASSSGGSKKVVGDGDDEDGALDAEAMSLELGDEGCVISSSSLTVEEVILRRAKRFRKLSELYKAQYWALMEELRSKRRRYYLLTGKSGWKTDVTVTTTGQDGEGEKQGGNEGGTGEEHCSAVVVQSESGTGAVSKVEYGSSGQAGNAVCMAPGCLSRVLALSCYCLSHIVLDPGQKLYKPCGFVLKSAGSGSSVCGTPVLCAVVPPLCRVHATQANKSSTGRQKKAAAGAAATAGVRPPLPVTAVSAPSAALPALTLAAHTSAAAPLSESTRPALAHPRLSMVATKSTPSSLPPPPPPPPRLSPSKDVPTLGSNGGSKSACLSPSVVKPMPRLHLVINEYMRIIQHKRRLLLPTTASRRVKTEVINVITDVAGAPGGGGLKSSTTKAAIETGRKPASAAPRAKRADDVAGCSEKMEESQPLSALNKVNVSTKAPVNQVTTAASPSLQCPMSAPGYSTHGNANVADGQHQGEIAIPAAIPVLPTEQRGSICRFAEPGSASIGPGLTVHEAQLEGRQRTGDKRSRPSSGSEVDLLPGSASAHSPVRQGYQCREKKLRPNQPGQAEGEQGLNAAIHFEEDNIVCGDMAPKTVGQGGEEQLKHLHDNKDRPQAGGMDGAPKGIEGEKVTMGVNATTVSGGGKDGTGCLSGRETDRSAPVRLRSGGYEKEGTHREGSGLHGMRAEDVNLKKAEDVDERRVAAAVGHIIEEAEVDVKQAGPGSDCADRRPPKMEAGGHHDGGILVAVASGGAAKSQDGEEAKTGV
ncbi:hypothetical protein CBR_g20294 [Chara braunii]|uniref:KAT8 regulatory NSL complex subunit 2 n=1 Tax=Chara braunii TaxID=69332 RepID=A0A388L031_CHABU|nr:hypothetical protein CBR_g20294 [Chara braunii]|eukprot:GBG75667.1 hypothetical protein CBR_g20294 [Chara braunii]